MTTTALPVTLRTPYLDGSNVLYFTFPDDTDLEAAANFGGETMSRSDGLEKATVKLKDEGLTPTEITIDGWQSETTKRAIDDLKWKLESRGFLVELIQPELAENNLNN